jgi:hypothetical protein
MNIEGGISNFEVSLAFRIVRLAYGETGQNEVATDLPALVNAAVIGRMEKLTDGDPWAQR